MNGACARHLDAPVAPGALEAREVLASATFLRSASPILPVPPPDATPLLKSAFVPFLSSLDFDVVAEAAELPPPPALRDFLSSAAAAAPAYE